MTLGGIGCLIMVLMWTRNEERSPHCGRDVAVTCMMVFSGGFVFSREPGVVVFQNFSTSYRNL